ncbi:MAG: M48 family metallopeptidase [Sulfurovum sp.]|nr:M48 family metallopeptidase [Sulfurovum sp.]
MSEILPTYTHIINHRLKHTYLSFDEEGRLIVKSPSVSHCYIEALLIKKSAWINKTRERILSKKGRTSTIREGGYFYFMGIPFLIVFREHTRRYSLFELEDSKQSAIFSHSHFDSALCQKKIEAYYKKEANSIIAHMVDRWATKMSLFPEAIHFRKTKRQWGSCSAKNVLSFNIMLMKVPLEAIEYVVVHELAHIAHKHHQKAFWQLVQKYLPDYKVRQDILRQYTPL